MKIRQEELAGEAWLNSPEKRALDIAYGTILAIPAIPLGVLTMAAARVMNGEGKLYQAARVDHNGNTENVFKIRLTRDDYGSTGATAKETGSSVTRFLRRTGMDELPQLANVLDGSMSIWGSRHVSSVVVEKAEAESPPDLFEEWWEKRLKSKRGLLSSYAIRFHLGMLPTAERGLQMVKLDIQDHDRASFGYDHGLLLEGIKNSKRLFRKH